MLLLVTQLIDHIIDGDLTLQTPYAVNYRDRYQVILFYQLHHIIDGSIDLGAYQVLVHNVLYL